VTSAERASAVLELAFPDVRRAEAVHKSIKQEEVLPKSTRCRAKVAVRKNLLCLEIDAEDTVALRAAVNSFLRWITVARDMVEIGSG